MCKSRELLLDLGQRWEMGLSLGGWERYLGCKQPFVEGFGEIVGVPQTPS
jgi:hypothetical protein